MEDLEEKAIDDFAKRCNQDDIRMSTPPMHAYSFGHEDGRAAMRPERKFYLMLGAIAGIAFTLATREAIDYYCNTISQEQKIPLMGTNSFEPKNHHFHSYTPRRESTKLENWN